MQKIDNRMVNKLVKKIGTLLVALPPGQQDASSIKVKPFPGKAPTRVDYFIFEYNTNTPLRVYRGKPNAQILLSMRAFWQGLPKKKAGVYYGWQKIEFDQNHVLSYENNVPDLSVSTRYIHVNWSTYHPGLWATAGLEWMQYPYDVDKGTYVIRGLK